jgi:hypothetical protein
MSTIREQIEARIAENPNYKEGLEVILQNFGAAWE